MFTTLDGFFAEHFRFCAGKFGTQALSSVESFACSDLVSDDRLAGVIAAYADRHGDIDRRAVLSVWSMYYFSNLVIAPLTLWLVFRQPLRLNHDNLLVSLDPDNGLPARIVLDDAAPVSAATIHEAFTPLIFDHAGAVIARFAREGLSPKLMWSNVAVYIDWIVRQLGARIDPALGREGLSILDCAIWPDGRPNPMHGLISRVSPEGAEDFTRRRVCCLRYLLPGMPGCGMVCPLPSGRA